jgi:hypothetical protein
MRSAGEDIRENPDGFPLSPGAARAADSIPVYGWDFLKATPGHDWEYKNQVAAGINPAAKAVLVQEFTRA